MYDELSRDELIARLEARNAMLERVRRLRDLWFDAYQEPVKKGDKYAMGMASALAANVSELDAVLDEASDLSRRLMKDKALSDRNTPDGSE
jgi:hypothetical protein